MENDERRALNRALYRRCKATFKHVQIKNVGEKQLRSVSVDLRTGAPRSVISHPGEYYAVCCPFCTDMRFRCYINHMYGQDDARGRPQTHLATCFNGGCPLASHTPLAYQQLEQILLGHTLISLRRAVITEGKEVDIDKFRMTWPGAVTRVDKLPATHSAVVYLAGRGFDVETIGRFYNVQWCSDSDRYICQDRLIIPIYHKQKMVGWQARAAYDTNWKTSRLPKYYTAPGTPKSQILYNFGNAIQYQVGIIVEGVTDVWKVGPQAVCTLGSTMSMQQQSLFRKGFQDYAGVLLYDPDVKEQTASNASAFAADFNSSLKSGFCVVQLPDGTDPGMLDRDFLRGYIEQQAAESGVLVSWARR